MEQVADYLNEHQNKYYAIKTLSRKFKMKKRHLINEMRDNKLFVMTHDGTVVGYGGASKLFIRGTSPL